MADEQAQRRAIERIVAELGASIPSVPSTSIIVEMMRRRKRLAEALRQIEAGTELGEIDIDLIWMLLERKAMDEQVQERLLPGQLIRTEESPPSQLDLLQKWLGPVSLALACAAVGGALGAAGSVWPFVAVLLIVGTILAWLSKIEHDRRYADVLASGRETMRRADASLKRLEAALNA